MNFKKRFMVMAAFLLMPSLTGTVSTAYAAYQGEENAASKGAVVYEYVDNVIQPFILISGLTKFSKEVGITWHYLLRYAE